jgi:hypothetical protein
MMLVHPEAPLLTKNDPLRGTYDTTFSHEVGDLSTIYQNAISEERD